MPAPSASSSEAPAWRSATRVDARRARSRPGDRRRPSSSPSAIGLVAGGLLLGQGLAGRSARVDEPSPATPRPTATARPTADRRRVAATVGRDRGSRRRRRHRLAPAGPRRADGEAGRVGPRDSSSRPATTPTRSAPGPSSRSATARSWGRFRDRTRPAPGNHDALTDDGNPYFAYFGTAAGPAQEGWYSYEAGTWHVIVLNSNCLNVGGCTEGSPQLDWLKADLAAHPAACTLAIWHHPRFTLGRARQRSPVGGVLAGPVRRRCGPDRQRPRSRLRAVRAADPDGVARPGPRDPGDRGRNRWRVAAPVQDGRGQLRGPQRLDRTACSASTSRRAATPGTSWA